ncbi:hypothetical protein QL898_06000 [Psychrobacter sp. APC 3279]|uniref:hypothetical protein n=1 Tax=Psychrobacter TaxID=497 RepID=UPI001919ABC7|nr:MULTISPECIES: hypothetical protein [Psychrobacter]MDN3441179.1 hypothetical protein [Psychrobacter sp. APC 3279]
MYKARKFSNMMNTFSFSNYQSQILSLIGLMILSLISISSHALVANPGATCQGITGASQGSLTTTDYRNLMSDIGKYVTVAGNASGSIPLQVKITKDESSSGNVESAFEAFTNSNKTVINIKRKFPTVSDYTDITFEFRNSITLEPIFLNNVAFSAFDIDYSNNDSNKFYDYVKFSGVAASGEINSVQQTSTELNGNTSFITNYQQAGLFTGGSDGRAFNCTAKNLGTECQGSIQFPEAVKSVKVRYTNTGTLIRSSPTTQEVDISLDNYCYVPQYIFSGTVFDDNGGIPAGSANKDNADITSSNSVYTNKPKFFNGIYDLTASETGISGSTVQLANCSNTSTIYPTQSVTRTTSPLSVGEYQISIPKTTLANNTNLCLVESRTGTSYPIRTSNESKSVGFSATTYNYPNNDFGRVIAENAALVLRKAQYVNNCPSTILYTDPDLNRVGETDLRNGFSESANNGNALTPVQCIAYRITATNRANVPITNFVMQDKLRSKSDGAAVTSTLANPVASTTDYASNSVSIGNNGTVITNPFTINARSNRNFYFNTKYGTTVNAQ